MAYRLVVSRSKNFFSVGNVCNTQPVDSYEHSETKGEAMRFEIMRLDEVNGTTVDSTVVDAASVNRIVQQAATIGQRLWIRPAESSAV